MCQKGTESWEMPGLQQAKLDRGALSAATPCFPGRARARGGGGGKAKATLGLSRDLTGTGIEAGGVSVSS